MGGKGCNRTLETSRSQGKKAVVMGSSLEEEELSWDKGKHG